MSGRYSRDYSAVYEKLPRVCRDRWTFKEIVEETGAFGERPYLIDASSGRTYSYAETHRVSNRIANGLLRLGLEKGDRVGVRSIPACVPRR